MTKITLTRDMTPIRTTARKKLRALARERLADKLLEESAQDVPDLGTAAWNVRKELEDKFDEVALARSEKDIEDVISNMKESIR